MEVILLSAIVLFALFVVVITTLTPNLNPQAINSVPSTMVAYIYDSLRWEAARVMSFRVPKFRGRDRAPQQHISKNEDRDLPLNPLVMKPNKVGISL